jgi:hypothetical protein
MRQPERSTRISNTMGDRRLQELIAVFHEAGGEPLAFRELLSEGIIDPAQRLYELEVAGYEFERTRSKANGGGVQMFRLVKEPGITVRHETRRPRGRAASRWRRPRSSSAGRARG